MSDQIQDRKAKLEKIRGLGVDPYGGRFPGVTKNADIRARGEALNIAAGEIRDGDDARFRAAGRIVLYRDIGSLIFLTVRDWSGELQFGISKKAIETATKPRSHEATRGDGVEGTEEEGTQARCHEGTQGSAGLRPAEAPPYAGEIGWKLAKLLDLGDIIGAEGRLGRTKTGELTLWVDSLAMLGKALRPPPEKWHGLADVELRYRKRYVDLLSNPESQRLFIVRAKVIDYIRGVLARRGVIEVETPVLQPIYGGAAARPFTTHHNTLDMDLYLRISPELYLKRCLVGGLERVYEFARCFRNEGISPRHNPEFTMLELYQAYGDYHDMMEITEEIIAGAARQVMGSYRIATKPRSHEATKGDPSREPPDPSRDREGAVGAGNATSAHAVEIDFTPPWPRRRYVDLVREYSGVDIRDRAAVLAKANDLGILAKFQKAHAAIERGADPAEVRAPGMEQLPDPQAVEVDHALLVNAIFEEEVEHHLMNPTFVVDYPAELCPLTKRHPSDPALALRFEAYIHGMEMGNAYSELNDPAVQLENLQHHVKGEGDETMRVMDEDFVEALEYAMPPAGGLGIGIDRLCMLLTGSASIRDVLLFPLQRPQA